MFGKKKNKPELKDVEQRIYANGKMGVFLRIRADGDPSTLRFACVADWGQRAIEFPTRAEAVKYADDYEPPQQEPRRIAGKTVAEWQEFARRDDCLDQMVPSDLRQLVAEIY